MSQSNSPAPNAVRVWRGFRALKYRDRLDDFYQQLGTLFIPITSQLMSPLGMCAYIPTVLHNQDDAIPDELALVFYASQKDYKTISKHTVAGRAYGALHGTTFNFKSDATIGRSASNFPTLFTGHMESGHSYYLFDQSADWSNEHNPVEVYVGANPNVNTIQTELHQFQKNPAGTDGAVVFYGGHYLVYWEHRVSHEPSQVISMLKSHSDPLYSDQAQPVSIPTLFSKKECILDTSREVTYTLSLSDQ